MVDIISDPEVLAEEQIELTPEQRIAHLKAELGRRELSRRYYSEYLAYTQGTQWKRTRMSEYIATKVQAFLDSKTGNAYDILLIETPPQHGKSMTVTETLPSWYMGKHPTHRVIIASYDSDFADKFCRRNKEKIRDFGSTVFNIQIGNIDRANEFELSNGKGRLISRGIMSGITGNPANLVIIDDPVKNMQEADSPTFRNRVWEEWQASIKSRLSAGGKVIVIMTPWHEDDFASRLMALEPNCTLLRLPVEAEANDPLGREIGEPLCPEFGKDEKWLKEYKQTYLADPRGGQRSWVALYQCSPRVESGNMIRRDWWRFYDPSETILFGTEIISVDAAFKDADTNDFVSVQVWGKHKTDYYLLYCSNKHLDFPATVQEIRAVKALYPYARTTLIEDKANGSAIISTLQKEMFIVPINPQGGKVSRVNAVAAAIESGHVYLPDPSKAAWVEGFVDQFAAFPNGAHDDMVDAASQALNRMIYYTGDFEPPKRDPIEEQFRKAADAFNDPDVMYNPYGQGGLVS